MSSAVCRWGILGTAGIARKNWHAMQLADKAELSAVASRRVDSAARFIRECQSEAPFEVAPEALGSYDALLDRDDIDAVYIPLPTGTRKEWILKAARAGKHVLAEKPCAIHADDLREILEVCEANQVQYMDGVMFMHSDRLHAIRNILDDGESIGEIRRMASHHTFAADQTFLDENIRLNSDLEPQGALGDLGWYSIRFFLWAMNWELPKQVSGRCLTETQRADSARSIPLEFSAELLFESCSASLYCSFITENQQWANIGGAKGFLYVKDFVLPFGGNELTFEVTQAILNIAGCQFNMEHHLNHFAVDESANNAVDAQETKMFQHFSSLVTEKQREATWGEYSLKTQRVMDACLRSAANNGQLETP